MLHQIRMWFSGLLGLLLTAGWFLIFDHVGIGQKHQFLQSRGDSQSNRVGIRMALFVHDGAPLEERYQEGGRWLEY